MVIYPLILTLGLCILNLTYQRFLDACDFAFAVRTLYRYLISEYGLPLNKNEPTW